MLPLTTGMVPSSECAIQISNEDQKFGTLTKGEAGNRTWGSQPLCHGA